MSLLEELALIANGGDLAEGQVVEAAFLQDMAEVARKEPLLWMVVSGRGEPVAPVRRTVVAAAVFVAARSLRKEH